VVTIWGGRHHTSAFRVCGCSFPYHGLTRERVSVPWVNPGTRLRTGRQTRPHETAGGTGR
jgi:hypothetical protein